MSIYIYNYIHAALYPKKEAILKTEPYFGLLGSRWVRGLSDVRRRREGFAVLLKGSIGDSIRVTRRGLGV